MKEFPIVQNALLRCERDDDLAHPLFKLVREDLNLWVWELGPEGSPTFEEWLPTARKEILKNLDLLKRIKKESRDFSLHVAVSASEAAPLVVDSAFAGVMHQVGFALELYVELPDSEQSEGGNSE